MELHNELYGYLQDKSQKYGLGQFDSWLVDNGLSACKQWTEEKKGVVQQARNVTLQTFIRNHIHHPENQTMQTSRFSEDELTQSIDEMIKLL